MVGQNIGKYRVADRVGRGGMGTVYRAVDETLHREVAIKVLNAELNDPEIAKRFRAEAITVARLNHPGIATIYELFQNDGQWLMVMEFVRGETLERMVDRMGPLSPQRSAELCMQSLAALAHAHSMGVVHRDLKPANIMITETGSVKIMDFGIARVSGTEHLTNAGYMMGTPAYMAPEQVLGKELDARADLYAMGVVFYRLVTKALPFKGETPFALAQSQVNDIPTPVGTLRTDLPPWVDQVIVRALAKNPEERFQSAVEFHEGFARCLAGLPLTASSFSTSAPTELMMTPARAMPTGTIRTPSGLPTGTTLPSLSSGPRPGDPPTGAPMSGAHATVAPTPAAPSPTAGVVNALPGGAAPVGVADPTVPLATAPRVKPAAATSPARSNTMALGVVAAVVVVIGALGAWFWLRPSPAPPVEPPPVAADTLAAGTGEGQAGSTSPIDPAAVPASGEAGGVPPAGAEAGAAGTGGSATAPTPSSPPAGAAGTGATAPKPVPPPVTPPPAATAPSAAGSGTTAPGRGATPPPATTSGRGTPPPATPAIDDSPLAFNDLRLVEVQGRDGRDRDAQLLFGDGRIAVMERIGGASIGALEYGRLTHATYVRARDPKWNPAASSPPADFNTPGTVFRRAAHWLVLQSADAYLILRLEDSNWERILQAIEARTGVKIARD